MLPAVAANSTGLGTPCSVGLVADLMRELDLWACQPQTLSAPPCLVKPSAGRNLISRDFTATASGTRLAGDILQQRHELRAAPKDFY